MVLEVDIARVVAIFLVHALEVAGGVKRPAVVIADEPTGVPGIGEAHLVAAVRAGIEHDPDRSVGLAGDDHRIFAHVGRQEVSGTGDLAFVGNEQPRPRENAVQLLLVDVGIRKDPAVKPAFLEVHVA